MARLPIPGGDNNTWGNVLNNFLGVEHNADGSQKTLGVSKGGTGATDASSALTKLGAASASDLTVGLAGKADDSAVVHQAGSETITGDKDFTGAVTKNGANLITKIQDAADVTVSSPANGDALSYDSTSGKWKNASGGSQPIVAAAVDAQATRQTAPSATGATPNYGGALLILSMGPTGTVWATNVGGTTLLKSTDGGSTWAQTCSGIAGHVQIEQVLELASGHLVATVRVSGVAQSGPTDVMVSTDGGATFTAIATQPFDQTNGASFYTQLLGTLSWMQMPAGSPVAASAIFMAEYGQNGTTSTRKAMHLFTSTDDGNTWTAAHTWDPATPADGSGSIRHLHTVQVDPYVAGRLWVCIGDDTPSEPRIGYSDDGGTTFTWITSGAAFPADGLPGGGYAQSRAVGVMFTPTAVLWGADTPDVEAMIYRYDRTSGDIKAVAGPWPNSFQTCMTYIPASGAPILLTIGSVEPVYQVNRDDILRAVGSADGGEHWNITELQWKRLQTNQTSTANVVQVAGPDANGYFWSYWSNVDAPFIDPVINLKGRLCARSNLDRDVRDIRARYEAAVASEAVTGGIAGTFSAAAEAVVCYADSDLYIDVTSVFITADSAHTSDGSNYWTLSLVAYDGTAGTSIATICAMGGASHAQAVMKPWNQVSANGLLRIAKGNTVALTATPTGSPANLVNPRVSLRIRRMNGLIS